MNIFDEYHPIWYSIFKLGNLIGTITFIVVGIMSQSISTLDLDYVLFDNDIPILWSMIVICIGVFNYTVGMLVIQHIENVAAIRMNQENRENQ